MTTNTTDTTNTTTTSDIHKQWLDAIDMDTHRAEFDRYFAPGEMGALLAKLWSCSLDEALRRCIELMKAGIFQPVREELNYQTSFEFLASIPTRRDRKDKRARAQGEAAEQLLVKLAEASPSEPFDCGAWIGVDVLFISFGKLVLRDFKLYPAPRAN